MKAELKTEPQLSAVRQAIGDELQDREKFDAAHHAEIIEKTAAGTHRFDIHPAQAVFQQPQGFLVNRAEDRKQRLERNAVAIKLWENRYVEVTDNGFIVRELEKPKRKLQLVKSNGIK